MIGTELLQLLQATRWRRCASRWVGPIRTRRPRRRAPSPPRRPRLARNRISDDGECAAPTAWRSYAYGWPPPREARQRPPAPRSLHRPCRSLDRRPWPPRARQTWFNCTVG